MAQTPFRSHQVFNEFSSHFISYSIKQPYIVLKPEKTLHSLPVDHNLFREKMNEIEKITNENNITSYWGMDRYIFKEIWGFPISRPNLYLILQEEKQMENEFVLKSGNEFLPVIDFINGNQETVEKQLKRLDTNLDEFCSFR